MSGAATTAVRAAGCWLCTQRSTGSAIQMPTRRSAMPCRPGMLPQRTALPRLCAPCLEHIDNNFNPLDAIQKGEFTDVAEDICYLLQVCRHKLETNNYDELETEIRKANDLNGQLSHLKREELQRIQSQSGSIKVSMVYLTMIQEAQNVVTYTINLMKVSRKFQVEKEEL